MKKLVLHNKNKWNKAGKTGMAVRSLAGKMLLTGLLACCMPAGAQAQGNVNFGWVDGFGGGSSSSDNANGVVSDATGNTYSIGTFYGTVSFGATTLTSTLTTSGTSSSQDVYLVKTDPAGLVLWAKQIGGVSTDQGNGIATDASGNIYITGTYINTVDFGGTTLSSISNGSDIYVAKYNSNGSLQWVKSMGGTGTEYGQYIAVNKATGDIFYAGAFWSTAAADMDPSPAATYTLTGASTSGDIFISKLDSNGDFVWAKKFGGTGTDLPYGLAVDAGGNVILSGAYSTTLTLDAVSLSTGSTSGTSYDGFVAKLNAAGTVQWAKKQGSTSASDYCKGVVTDASGNIYVAGYVANSATAVDLGGNTLTGMYGAADIVISKLAGEGLLLWTRLLGGSGADNGVSIAIDNTSNIYTTGTYSNTAEFNPAATSTLTSTGGTDVFIHKMESSGNFVWVKSIGGSGSESVSGIDIDGSGNILLSGTYVNTANFSTSSSVTQNLTSNGAGDAFVLKLMPTSPTPLSLTAFTAEKDGASALLQWETASEKNVSGFFIERSSDARNWEQAGFVAAQSAGAQSTGKHFYNFSDNSPLKGTNFYRLKNTDRDGAYTYSGTRSLYFGAAADPLIAYPNPVSDKLYIRTGKTGPISFQLTDMLGREVKRGTLAGNGSDNRIDVNALTPGTYLLKVISGTETDVLKIKK